ncbi:SnoaL-like domain-containing protein [Collimonas sp. OK607]|uniref:nuclear transport factor 2 family protein n=1 Tax=Collimonas sp. OK607 TaxID=1798194 RepID=UPI0008E1032A|nr:nuclear transport factor 2 family protein [Collimonas sp. OK607]SFB34575.1 SnoaL-like domain-containing protein [Collimonas sp. OK607]
MESLIAQNGLLFLNADYWERADERSVEPTEQLFTASGELVIGSLVLSAQDQIRTFFQNRAAHHAQVQRHTRHVSSNLKIQLAGDRNAQMSSLVMVFAGLGTIPLESELPSAIADVADICVRDKSGIWKFARRTITPVFVGAGAASFTAK